MHDRSRVRRNLPTNRSPSRSYKAVLRWALSLCGHDDIGAKGPTTVAHPAAMLEDIIAWTAVLSCTPR